MLFVSKKNEVFYNEIKFVRKNTFTLKNKVKMWYILYRVKLLMGNGG